MREDNQVGKCPICHSDNINYDSIQLESDMTYYPYTCEDCGTQGEEWYKIEFVGHNIDNMEVEYVDLNKIRKEKKISVKKDYIR